MQKAGKATVKLIKAGEEATILFDLVHKALNQMTLSVEPGVVIAPDLARLFRWNDGNRALLVQVFLNLVQNAAEEAPANGGEITLVTAYRHGMRAAMQTGAGRV